VTAHHPLNPQIDAHNSENHPFKKKRKKTKHPPPKLSFKISNPASGTMPPYTSPSHPLPPRGETETKAQDPYPRPTVDCMIFRKYCVLTRSKAHLSGPVRPSVRSRMMEGKNGTSSRSKGENVLCVCVCVCFSFLFLVRRNRDYYYHYGREKHIREWIITSLLAEFFSFYFLFFLFSFSFSSFRFDLLYSFIHSLARSLAQFTHPSHLSIPSLTPRPTS
jgi:hypothetical protein